MGRYSNTLSYKDWYQFNNAQRVHYNLVENIASIITLHLCAGVQVQFCSRKTRRPPARPHPQQLSPYLIAPLAQCPRSYFPRAAAAIAVPWLVARHGKYLPHAKPSPSPQKISPEPTQHINLAAWGVNYVTAGPEGRYNNIAVLHQLALITWFGLAVAGSLKATGLITTSMF